jgi:AdoMet-dependent rRNA methyltransferase SPB1
LDPRSVFAELADPTPNNEAKVFNPEKKKRKRDGYAEGDHTQFKEAPVTDFIQTTDPIAMLGGLNKLSFEHNRDGDIALAALEKLPETTREIQDCCADLKVLGRKEFRSLLKWRLKVREVFGLALKKTCAEEDNEAEEVAEVAPMDEELRIQEELQRLNEQESGRKKRERRRENERKQKEIVRMQLRMTAPSEIGLEQSGPNGEDAMFALKIVDKADALDKVVKGKMNLVVTQEVEKSRNGVKERQKDDSSESEGERADPEGDLLERELDLMYQQYQESRSVADAKYRAKKARKEHEDGEWEGFSEKGESSDNVVLDESSEDPSDVEEPDNLNKPLTTTLATNDVEESGLTRRAAIFFDQDIFKGINDFNSTAEGNGYECTLTEKSGFLNKHSSGLLKNTNVYPPNGKSVKSNANTLNKPAQAGKEATIRESTSFELVKSTEEKGDWEGHHEPRRDGQSGWFLTSRRLRHR